MALFNIYQNIIVNTGMESILNKQSYSGEGGGGGVETIRSSFVATIKVIGFSYMFKAVNLLGFWVFCCEMTFK